MNSREWEDQSTNHLLQFLKDSRGEAWRIVGREVEVDPVTHENFDFELAAGERRIALELFRLVESEPELADRVAWYRFAKLLGDEMERRGLNDYSVEVPCITNASPQVQAKKVREIVDRLEEKVKGDQRVKEAEIDHITFRRTDGLGAPRFWSVGDFGMYDSVDSARRILEGILPKKNKQVSMPGHEGVLLVVHWLGLVNAQDFTDACTRVDLSRFPNIARIYFLEEEPSAVTLTFERVAV